MTIFRWHCVVVVASWLSRTSGWAYPSGPPALVSANLPTDRDTLWDTITTPTRRQSLISLATGITSLTFLSPPVPRTSTSTSNSNDNNVAWAASWIPDPQGITTVILDSSDQKIGVELYDVTIGYSHSPGNNRESSETVPAVKSVNPTGVAASQNVEPGMVLLGNYHNNNKDNSPTKNVIHRIKNGPYPIVLQFYNLGLVGDYVDAPVAPSVALTQAQERARQTATTDAGPQLSSKGTGLIVKTIQAPTVPCPQNKDRRVRRGDTLEILFEARVASPGGPVYDSTAERGKSVSFTVGAGEVVNGVDIGVYDMCPGEIRTMDIPASLGYGRAGSHVFDIIPGDVRLWWRIELLKLTKKQ